VLDVLKDIDATETATQGDDSQQVSVVKHRRTDWRGNVPLADDTVSGWTREIRATAPSSRS
jgi:hypothetical protein